jgi:tetratricopeptide (TPR) repeat protein
MPPAFAAWVFALILGLLVVSCGVLLTTLHELGHALAALVLQSGRVTVYLGSHGQAAGGGRLQCGRLRLYFRFNPWRLAFGGGLCRPRKPIALGRPRWRSLLFILAGPLLPLLVAAVLLGLLFTVFNSALPVVKAVPVMFFGITILSALFNLLPRRRAIALANGQHTPNDGAQTLLVLQHSRLVRQAREADARYAAADYEASSRLDGLLLEKLGPQAVLYRRLILAHLALQRYQQALAVSRQFEEALAADFTDADRFTQALLLSRTDQHVLALAAYSALIDQPVPYPSAYNNRGYTHTILANYELAINDFNQAIAANAEVAYAYNNRGLAQLRLGQEAAGLADIEHGLHLDPTNAYGYRNLGIYHLDRGAYATALGFFEQAQRHDPHTHMLASYLQQTRQHLEASSGAGG